MAAPIGCVAALASRNTCRSETHGCRNYRGESRPGNGAGGWMNAIVLAPLVLVCLLVGTYSMAVLQQLILLGPRRVSTAFQWPIVNALLRSEEHTSELQSPCNLVCRLLLEKKKKRRLLQ